MKWIYGFLCFLGWHRWLFMCSQKEYLNHLFGVPVPFATIYYTKQVYLCKCCCKIKTT